MPKLDGFGLLRHIRQHPRTVDLPVIISTGYDDRTSIEEAYRLGASSFVTKPINWAQFGYHAQFVIRNGEIERDLRRAEAEAVAASKMKNGLFRILSHELKTPLVALIGLTDVLAEALKDKVEAIEAEQLGHIVGASQRLNRLISDILVLSKSFSGASSLRVSNESMTDLLDDSIIGLEANAKAKSIKIKIARPGKGLMLRCDSQLLRQAIKKLVDNAIKFSPDGGTIEIWAHRKPDHSTVISVRDNGPGISPQNWRNACCRSFRKTCPMAGPPRAWAWACPSRKPLPKPMAANSSARARRGKARLPPSGFRTCLRLSPRPPEPFNLT